MFLAQKHKHLFALLKYACGRSGTPAHNESYLYIQAKE